MRPENDRKLSAVQDLARGIQREPTATVELTERELRAILLHDDSLDYHSGMRKLGQALQIESGPNGNFWDGGAAA